MKTTTIKFKLLLLATLTSIALLLMLAVLFYATERQNELKKGGDEVYHLLHQLEKLRGSQIEFLTRKDQAFVDKFEKEYLDISNAVSQIEQFLLDNGLSLEGITDSKGSLEKYRATFLQLVKIQQKIGLNEKEGMYKAVETASIELERKVKAANVPKIKELFANMKRWEESFKLRRNIKFKIRFQVQSVLMNQQLKNLTEIPEEEREEIKNLLNRFTNSFFEVVTVETEKGLSHNDGVRGSLDGSIRLASKLTGEESHSIEVYIKDEIKQVKIVAASISGVLVVVILLIILFIGIDISRVLGGEPQEMQILTDKISKGDLRRGDGPEGKGLFAALQQMASKMGEIILGVEGNAQELASSAAQMSASTVQIVKTTEEINKGTEYSAQSITEVNDNITSLRDSLDDTNRQATEISQLANQASTEASRGTQAMQETIEVIKNSSESSTKIEGIINMITEIANQTNLLSLNAAIEAAKAGEFGKGFAVVADEVRNLAERSGAAVDQIRILIDDSSTTIKEGITVVEHTAEILDKIIREVSGISERTDQINDIINNQNQQAQEITEATDEIRETTDSNAAAMNELTSAITEMELTAESLANMADTLQDTVAIFKI